MTRTALTLILNDREEAVFVEPGQNLLEVLRRTLGDLTPKYGCGQGTCGCCSVIIDSELRLACLTLAESVQGARVETVASLADGADLHPLQRAFMEHFAAQCGYCTPGMLLAAKSLLDSHPSPTREQVIEAISGNVCRCTGYEPIIQAILDAASASVSGRTAASLRTGESSRPGQSAAPGAGRVAR